MDHNRKVVEILLDDVLPNRFQPRIKFNEESIIELSESIKEHGVIQPIVVRPVGDKFEIIAGERRYKASCMAGLEKIPALLTDLNDKDSAEVALIENVQRKDLTPIEEAISYKKILDMGYLTQEKLAEKLGKKQSTVANKLRLLNLDEDVQEAILEDKISERHARSILKLTNPDDQKKILNKIIEERLTVRKTDEEINKMLNENRSESISQNSLAPEVLPQPSIDKPSEEATPFDFSKLDFLQNEATPLDSVSEESKSFEIPKFEELLFEDNIENEEEHNISNNLDLNKENLSEKVTLIEDLNTNDSISSTFESEKTEEPKTDVENNAPVEFHTPFVFDNLFMDGDSLEKVQQDDDVEEIEYIDDFIDENEKNEEINLDNNMENFNDNSNDIKDNTKPFDFDFENNQTNKIESGNKQSESVGTNMYVTSDIKTVINTIRNCAETIQKYGFKVNLEEIDLEDMYRVVLDVKK